MANLGALKADTAVGSYKIVEAVGVNSHSIVYRARVDNTDEEILLQEFVPFDLVSRQRSDQNIRPRQGKDEPFEHNLSLFLQEARILSQIQDPYVARVREYTEARGTAFIAMELEQGQTLDKHLKQVGKIEDKELRQLFLSLLKGLRVIHANNLIHRDINPGSIFLRDAGPPLILGFGSTQRALATAESGIESRVTPGFSPIEQYHAGGNIGPWTDLYAVGAVFYKSITGISPVDAPKRVAALAEGRQDPLIPAAEIGRGDYHASILSGIDWLLKPFIDKRPKSAGEILGTATEPTPHKPSVSAQKTIEPESPPCLAKPASKGAPIPRDDLTPDSPKLHADPSVRIGSEPHAAKRWTNYLAWLIVVVFGVAVGIFTFWPQIKSVTSPEQDAAHTTPTTIEGTSIPDNILEQPLPDAEAPPEPPESIEFTRKEDDVRADQFRKIEQYDKKIRALLESARAKLLVGKLTTPETNNALADYRAILTIDEDNVDALQGIEDIAISLFNRAETEFEQGDLEASQKTLLAMQQAGIETEGVNALSAEINKLYGRKAAEEERTKELAEQERLEQEKLAEQERIRQAELAAEQVRLEQQKLAEQERLEQGKLAEQERIRQAELAAEQAQLEQEKLAEQEHIAQARLDQQQAGSARVQELLTRAEVALAAGLNDSSAENALTHYREVLSIDPTNEAALAGISNIAQHYIELANRALGLDQFERVENHLLLISAIEPNHPAVNLIRSQLQIRREAFAQAQLQQQREKELEQAAQQKAQQELLRQKELELAQRTLTQGINAYYRGEYSTALELLLPVAESGSERAQFRVGVMYLRGRGTEKDAATGTAWIRKAFPAVQSAATGGEAWAQADLGSLYQTGLLVAQNDKEAVRWYLRAAEQGYAGAQTNLGTMYASGSGVAKSRDEAIKWLQRAAAQGDKVAQKNLNTLGVQ